MKKSNLSKNKRIIYTIALLIIVIATAIYTIAEQGNTPDASPSGSNQTVSDDFSVHFIDVGQGDCSLVLSGGKSLLIDAGENGHETKVINYLRSQGVEKLDYIIATHQHSDHIGGLPEVIEEFGAYNIIMPRLTKELTPTNKTYTAFLNAVKESGAKVISAKPGAVYTLGEAEFEILGPVSNNTDDLNNMSVVARLVCGGKSFLFTGDAEKSEEAEIIENGASLNCDVLKVGHHGSKTSSGVDFLSAVSPEICVIMCGKDNDYGHPHSQILNRIDEYADTVYRTDICGDIVMTLDGGDIAVKYENE